MVHNYQLVACLFLLVFLTHGLEMTGIKFLLDPFKSGTQGERFPLDFTITACFFLSVFIFCFFLTCKNNFMMVKKTELRGNQVELLSHEHSMIQAITIDSQSRAVVT